MTNKNCYWHPDRYAGVTCQRCERRVCAECMHTASVGFHCPACIAPQSINHGRKRISARSFARGSNASEQSLTTRTLIAVNLFAFFVTLFRGGSLSSGGGDVTIDFGLVGYSRVLSAFSIDYVVSQNANGGECLQGVFCMQDSYIWHSTCSYCGC